MRFKYGEGVCDLIQKEESSSRPLHCIESVNSFSRNEDRSTTTGGDGWLQWAFVLRIRGKSTPGMIPYLPLHQYLSTPLKCDGTPAGGQGVFFPGRLRH